MSTDDFDESEKTIMRFLKGTLLLVLTVYFAFVAIAGGSAVLHFLMKFW